jgi:hypothetical protein
MNEPIRTNDATKIGRAQARAKRLIEQQAEDLKSLLALAEFRRFVWRLIGERCKLLESPGSANGSIQSCNIGRQDVGRELWIEIEGADPLAIPLMMGEYHEAQKP